MSMEYEQQEECSRVNILIEDVDTGDIALTKYMKHFVGPLPTAII